jgi:hypothetical protein
LPPGGGRHGSRAPRPRRRHSFFVDAWFDVLTASSRSELLIAIVEAAVVELPIAVFCLLLARSVERRLAAAELAAADCA